ncbi:hypothetical protein BSPA14S_H0018 (plasmid) [Borreliella spielmanii A14S]|uniref:Uncharacterized protein n=1 Tax=Borreliella spielmanii A14S TaxID=498742 RepID=C0RCE4_9SPIR|nr:hypothetical protein BSPA14S_H0018 [Borreliella spielmanii A14S]
MLNYIGKFQVKERTFCINYLITLQLIIKTILIENLSIKGI